MKCEEVLREVERGGVIAILRGDLVGREVEIVEALLAGGVTAVEVTCNSPGVMGVIARLRREIKQPFALGVGTVLQVAQAEAARDAGAEFVVSPNISVGVIEATKRMEMASFPGGATCTEMLLGLDAGADAIKVFPASAMTPKEMATIRGPLGDVRLVPTGSVGEMEIRAYCEAGAWAFGIGSSLVNMSAMKTLEELEQDAARWVRVVAEARIAAARSRA
jgi:2-dehydro-3-deoxyphosphogluconate aldolase / (4S)-4-hydroxy-2-oxoglutarate aldolase